MCIYTYIKTHFHLFVFGRWHWQRTTTLPDAMVKKCCIWYKCHKIKPNWGALFHPKKSFNDSRWHCQSVIATLALAMSLFLQLEQFSRVTKEMYLIVNTWKSFERINYSNKKYRFRKSFLEKKKSIGSTRIFSLSQVNWLVRVGRRFEKEIASS